MVNLNLDIDEKILTYTDEFAVQINSDDKYYELDELYLTNKNIISVYEKCKGLFSGSETVVDRIPLGRIKAVDGDVQITKIVNPDWDEGLQIFLNDGRRVQFCFDINNDLDAWISNVANATVGKTELIKDVKPETTGTSESIFNDLKDLKESAKRLASGIAAHANRTMQAIQDKVVGGQPAEEKQNYTPTRASTDMKPPAEGESPSQEEIIFYCTFCGKQLKRKYTYCPCCGNEITQRF